MPQPNANLPAHTANYIVNNRALTEGIKRACQQYDIRYEIFSNDWIVRLQKGSQIHFVYGYMFSCNNQASTAIAADKVATYQILANSNVVTVPHYLLKSILDTHINEVILNKLFELHKSVVVKPLRGDHGRAVARFDNPDDALRFAHSREVEAWAISPYINITRELRLIVFEHTVAFGYEKIDPKIVNNLKMYNFNLGARTTDLDIQTLHKDILDLAVHALDTIGLTLGAVDIIFDNDGHMSVLEINSGFSLEPYAITGPRNREKVITFYEHVIKRMFFIP